MNVLKLLGANATAAPSGISFSFRTSGSSTNLATITIPASTQEGDLIVLSDRAVNSSGTPTGVVPTGFTSIFTVSSGTTAQIITYKIASSSDAGSTITGMSGTSSTRKTLLILNTDSSSPYITVFAPKSQMIDSAPNNQVVDASENSNPLVVLGFYGQTTANSQSMSPTEDGVAGNSSNAIRYKIYNSSAANVTCSMGDGGNGNFLGSCYIAGYTAAPSGSSLIDAINAVGLTSNLKLCLDAGDSSSYDPAIQTDKWLDVSGNGYDFFRGAGTGTQASDPVFNGTAGGLSVNEYWSLNGTRYFTYDTTNETWMNNLHKDNAKFSFFIVCRTVDNVNPQSFFGTNGAATGAVIGVRSQINASETFGLLMNNNSTLQTISTTLTASINQVNIFMQSQDESSATGLYSAINSKNSTIDGTYTSPSASNATYTMQIAASGNAERPLSSGSRLYCIAIWEGVALTSTNLTDLYNQIKGRFGL